MDNVIYCRGMMGMRQALRALMATFFEKIGIERL